MPASASVINNTLTTYAQGYAQDNASVLADFISPRVMTGAASGQYKTFDEKNDFVTYKTERALGGGRTRIEFHANDKFFNCRPNGMEIVIDDHERRLAGDNDTAQLNLSTAKTNTLISTAITSREVAIFNMIKEVQSAVPGAGVWSDATVDPIAELDAQILAIAKRTGQMPNRMVIGIEAWAIIRNHPLVKARIDGINLTFSLQDLKDSLIHSDVDIRVGVMTMDENKFGKGKDARFIVGGEVFLFIGSDNPTTFDPSFSKTFETVGGGVDSVRERRDADDIGDVIAVDWTEDPQVVSPISASRITLS